MDVTVPTFLVARNFIANDVDVQVKVTIDSDGVDM